MNRCQCRAALRVAVLALVTLAVGRSAIADVHVSGSVGAVGKTDAAGDTFTYGFALGSLGSIFGFELDFGRTPDVFSDESLVGESSVTTVSGNLLVGPRISLIQPYGTVGVGLIRTSIRLPRGAGDLTSNNGGVNVGGGIFIGGRLSFRGDVRYFRSADVDLLGFDLGNLDFWRATAGLALRF